MLALSYKQALQTIMILFFLSTPTDVKSISHLWGWWGETHKNIQTEILTPTTHLEVKQIQNKM